MVSATTTVHVYEWCRPGIPMTTTVSPKHSISLPFAADNLTGVGFRCRPSAIFCGKIVIKASVFITKFSSFGQVLVATSNRCELSVANAIRTCSFLARG